MRARKQRTKKQRIAAAVVRGDDVPLEQRKFGSEVEGRTALHARGFRQMHTPAGTPLLWIKEGDQRAVARRGRKAPWMIVKYPMEVLRTAQRKIEIINVMIDSGLRSYQPRIST